MVEERGFRGVSRLSSKCLDMVTTIAVAGAGALGKAIINELKSGPQYRVVVLSRKVTLPCLCFDKSSASNKATQGTPKSDIPIVAIDYSNPSGIATTFEEYKITTVICAIAVIDQGSCEAQLNLIRAANSSTTVKRFIPSDFGIHFKEGHVETFPLVAFKLAAAKLLTTTRLEYTLFHCGFFLDFFGHPKISNLKDAFPLVVDVENNVAAIPGNGDVQCAFTHTNDVAKLLVKGLELEKWPEHLFMSGDKKTWKEVLALAEEVKGKIRQL